MRPARLLRNILLLGLLCLPAVGRAQETQSEEAAKRAKLLQSLPDNAAKRIFGAVSGPAPLEARSIGFYARGCLAGARALPVNGETWQVMRVSRNRMWGHPDLIALLERLSARVPKEVGWPGILVGDISQPRGGPMLTGHASHQVGLDADVWLTPMPTRTLSGGERENMSATNLVAADWMHVDTKVWTPAHLKIIRLAAKEPKVERIFVNPAIKKALCEQAGSDRDWLSKVRPMWGHNYHFHIRTVCPAGDATCRPQDPPPDGDGCGSEVSNWLKMQHNAIFGPKRPGPPPKPKPPWTLDDLPEACRAVVVSR